MDIRFNAPQEDVVKALFAGGQIRQGLTHALPWGRGTGKSWFLRLLCYLLVAQFDGKREGAPTKGIRVTWLMDTKKHWSDVHSELMRRELNDDWAPLRPNINQTTWRVRFPGESLVQVFPALEHTSKAGLGHRTDVILVDEADDVPIPVFQSVAHPWFSEPWSLKIRLAGGTPRRGRYGLLYHLHQLGLSQEPQHQRYLTRHATYAECPEHVDRSVVEDARATWHPAAFSREWECNFDSAEGLVYALFDERVHIGKPTPGTVFTEILIGVDWGFSEPGAFLVIGITGHGEDAEAWILEEQYETELVPGQWVDRAKELRARYPQAKWYADPSRPDNIVSLQNDARVDIAPADNALQDGVGRVATMLFVQRREVNGVDAERTRLHVAPECTNTIREFSAYKRKPDPFDPETFTDTIIDRDNHAMDALRYALFSRFGMPPGVPRVRSHSERQ